MNAPPSPAPAVILHVARRVALDEALAWQEAALAAMRDDPAAPERVFLVEHTPVVTLGRSGDGRHLRLAPQELAARGIAYRPVRRGGDVTYHGPGQWTLYPVLRLATFCKDLHRYMRLLEETAIRYLAGHGLRGERVPGRTGVWVGHDKLAAVGVAVTRWISHHGMAVNIRPDLAPFRDYMTPCGIAAAEGGVTSLAECTGSDPDMETEGRRLLEAFFAIFPHRPAAPVAEAFATETTHG